jgi:hypothetical protein
MQGIVVSRHNKKRSNVSWRHVLANSGIVIWTRKRLSIPLVLITVWVLMPKSKTVIQNVLAERYASDAMKSIWSGEGRVIIERDYWIAVLKAQRELGLKIPLKAIKAYEKVKGQIDLESIDRRERKVLHDVKARIEEFSDLAGYEFAHLGMTSRDLTEMWSSFK